MGDEAHLKSIAVIPQLIENSIFITELPNNKDNGKYDSYKYYACGLEIDGQPYTVKVTIGVKGANKYYDHSLTEIEKGSLIDNIDALTNTFDADKTSYESLGKDTKLLSILQTEQDFAKKIKLATGWERGADGEWRYEQSDGTSALDPGSRQSVGAVDAARDAEYERAVESGDMETAQKMVDERAKAAGYHNVSGFYIKNDIELESGKTNYDVFAYEYGKHLRDKYGEFNEIDWWNEMEPDTQFTASNGLKGNAADLVAFDNAIEDRWNLYLRSGVNNLGMPKYVFARRVGEIPPDGSSWNFRDNVRESGVSVMGLYEGDKFSLHNSRSFLMFNNGKQYVVYGLLSDRRGSDGEYLLNKAQMVSDDFGAIKSADAVTYDNDGKVIPLSQRFNEANDDIRNSIGKAAEKIVPPERREGEDRRSYGERLYEWNKAHQDFDEMNPLSEDERKALGDKTVKNVIISGDDLPRSKSGAIVAIRNLDPEQKGMLNDESQEYWLFTAKNLRHSATTNHENPDLFKISAKIDEVIKEAKKLCNIPVKEDRWRNVTNAEVYYCPVNVDGKQYSARLNVLTYSEGMVREAEVHLYDANIKEELNPTAKTMASGEGAVTRDARFNSLYKIRDLVHNTQEIDKKFLSINGDARFSIGSIDETPLEMAERRLAEYRERKGIQRGRELTLAERQSVGAVDAARDVRAMDDATFKRYYIGKNARVRDERRKAVGRAVAEVARDAGIDVVMDKDEMQRVLNENLSEIWQYLNTPLFSVTSSSPKDAAKLSNLLKKRKLVA